jgi:hypothetical protein
MLLFEIDVAPDYAVTYDLNGGIGRAPIQPELEAGMVFAAAYPDRIAPPDGDMYFAGWNASADGGGMGYQPGEMVAMPDDDLTLYAIWAYFNRADLANAIKRFESLNKLDWSAGTYGAALELYIAGKAILENPAATQGEIDAAAAALNAAIDMLAPVTFAASVEKLTGNTNYLTVTVYEWNRDGTVATVTEKFEIKNNAIGVYGVGPYDVYVDTKGNDKIKEIYLME